MDTKWKNRKRIISFLVFFLGVSLGLGSLADLLRKKPSGVHVWEVGRLLEYDYQEGTRFREYVENRLGDFLVMATGGEGLLGIWGYDDGTYYGSDYVRYYDGYDYSGLLEEIATEEGQIDFSMDPGNIPAISPEELLDYAESLKSMQESYMELLDAMNDAQDPESREAFRDELKSYGDEMRGFIEDMESYLPDRLYPEQIKSLTDEQKQKIAQKYHDNIKGDKNLLYAIAYDGRELYSNSDLIAADGSLPAPEGYNFILHFDGEKVRILKDGREVDVYGDGYYREEGDWYVPGYANFQTDDIVKKASVYMAVAKDPVLYTEGSYQKGGSLQYDNSLYWMNKKLQISRESIRQSIIGLAVSLVLLLAAIPLRKSRKQAVEKIACFQAGIWLECKILLLLALLYGLYMLGIVFVMDDYRYSLWEEVRQSYDYNLNSEAAVWFGRELLGRIPPVFWILLFWGLWLLWNDLRHNRKIWRCSLTAKLCAAFTAKNLNQPLSLKMTRRNRAVFLTALVYGVLMLEEIMLTGTVWRGENALTMVLLLAVLETVLFLVLLYLAGTRNIKAAHEVEALSRRIAEIRSGDYRDRCDREKGAAFADGAGLQAGSAAFADVAVAQAGGETSGDGPEPGAGNDVPVGSCSSQTGSVSDLEPVMAQLEDIRHGMAQAVDEQMKSERMKVELIANVSHDIKTPLTSIISYVEILKQEENLPDYIKDYIRILDEKSQRLKNMVTDVFAVSKAASGELPMEMGELDFGKLLRQTLADMEEQIENSDVAFRTDIPDVPVMIMADGQRLYRVFQNLFQNAIKYSLQGSRVYVALHTDGSLAVASVKNTSSQELEKGKNFAERFARGDASRTDGGSGLGLSIAQSFTEACGGQFSWETDADLFVVKITFRTLQGNDR